MAVSQLIRSFSGGELSPYCDALTTSDKYPTGCRVLENFIPTVYGPVNRRPGLEMISAAFDDSHRVRLMPFVFSDTERYVMEFGNHTLRVFDASTKGLMIFTGGAPQWVTGTAYTVGQKVLASPLGVGTFLYVCATAHTAGTFAFDLAAGKWTLLSSITSVATPYSTADLREVQIIEINDIAYLTHPLYAPQKIERTALKGTIFFNFEETPWFWPALLDENTDSAAVITPTDITGAITLNASGTFPGFNSGQEGGYFQLSYERPSSSATITFAANGSSSSVAALGGWSLNTYGTWAATLTIDRSTDNGITWSVIRSFTSNDDRNVTTTGEEPRNSLLRLTVSNRSGGTINDFATLEMDDSRLAGIVKITNVIDPVTAQATVINDLLPTGGIVEHVFVTTNGGGYSAAPAVTISGGGGSGATAISHLAGDAVSYVSMVNAGTGYTSVPTVTIAAPPGLGERAIAYATIIPPSPQGTSFWSEGAWSNYRGFPRTITTHENRIFYGGTAFRPQSIWATAIDDFENFRLSILADAGLYFTFITRRTNPIQWMFSKDGSLQIGTLGSEGSIDSSDASSALSPSDIQWTDLTSYGSRHLPAIVLQDSLFFVQKAGRKIRIRRYDWNRRAYGAPDVTVFAEHVTSPAVVEYDSQQHPEGILWCVRDDGQLIGMTYDYDQQVTAWHRHITAGTFESVCVIPGDTGDEVWVATMRTINGVTRRFIERFKPDWRETFDAEDKPNWFYLDCAKRIVNGSPSATVTGLDYLNGQLVSILADGATMEPRVVSGGSITLDAPAIIVIVGLPYISTLRPMKLNLDLQDGTSRARKARIAKVTAQVLKSLGCSISTDGQQFDELLFRSTDDDMDDSPPSFSGECELIAGGNYSDGGGDIWVRQADPMPLTIICLTPVWTPTSN